MCHLTSNILIGRDCSLVEEAETDRFILHLSDVEINCQESFGNAR